MNELRFQRLSKYSSFIQKLSEKNLNIAHLGITVSRYFGFAELQIREFEKNVKFFFDSDSPIHQDYAELCYSNAFGFYTSIRTSFEACRRLSDEIQQKDSSGKLQTFREGYSKQIARIIDIANDIVKHPLEDSQRKKSYFYEPGGLDFSGNMDIYEWSITDRMYFNIQEINPIDDCNCAHQYLEELASTSLDVLESQCGEIPELKIPSV